MTRVLIDEKYEIIRKIKEGGFGIVYFGWDLTLDKPVAIKEIAPYLLADPQYMDMFTDEALNTAKLNHANIVQVLDLRKTDEGRVFLIMEYIEGVDLRSVLERCQQDKVVFPQDLGVHTIAEVCKALDFAHQAKDRRTGLPLDIIHRDISPSNVMLSTSGEVRLIDFGIAKTRQRMAKETRTGILKGKLNYMSPEQVEGKKIDTRSDLFSLGIVLYEVLTSRQLFSADSDFSLMKAIAAAQVETRPLLEKKVPVALQQIVTKALKKDPLERYQSAREMYADLHNYLRTSSLEVPQDELARYICSFLTLHPEETPLREDTTDTLKRIADKSKQIIPTREVAYQRVRPPVGDGAQRGTHEAGSPATGEGVPRVAGGTADAEPATIVKKKRHPKPKWPSPPASRKVFRAALIVGLVGAAVILAIIIIPPETPVIIDTFPREASVVINGKPELGRTPLKLPDLPKGEYDLVFAKAGLPDLKVHLAYPKKEKKEFTYTFEAPLRLETAPAGAMAVVNGEELGTTPLNGRWKVNEPLELKFRLSEGEELAGFRIKEPLNREAEISDPRFWHCVTADTPFLSFTITGYFKKEVRFQSEPPGAWVLSGADTLGQAVQEQPVWLPYGRNRLRFVLPDYRPRTLVIEVGSQSDSTHIVTLEPVEGGLARVLLEDEQGTPLPNVEVYIREWVTKQIVAQGHSDKNGIFSVRLGGGRYKLRLEKEGFSPHSEDFAVQKGEGKTIHCILRKTPLSLPH